MTIDARVDDVLRAAVRAIGDHSAPDDCYATGPLTGDPWRDLIECPACTFLAKYNALTAVIPPREKD